jgi:hypothetical protein
MKLYKLYEEVLGEESGEDMTKLRNKLELLTKQLNNAETEEEKEIIFDEYLKVKKKIRNQEYIDKYGTSPLENLGQEMSEFIKGLSFGKLSKGSVIGNSSIMGDIYSVNGNTTLFRSVTIDDWVRIQSQGYIDTDGRGAISPGEEGINLAEKPSTALTYIPPNKKGVILAIDTNGLDLFMIEHDDYIRTHNSISVENIKKVSKVFGKTDMGGVYEVI